MINSVRLSLKLLSVFVILFVTACDEPNSPPSLSITSPQPGRTYSELVKIEVATKDEDGISKVEFHVNDSLLYTATEAPYNFDWNTSSFEDGFYEIKVKSYDNTDNSTQSTITLWLNNTQSYPKILNILSIDYTLNEMMIVWEKSDDTDFDKYQICVSDSPDVDKSVLATVADIEDTVLVLDEFDPTILKWYWMIVTDIYGLSSTGRGYRLLEPSPEKKELYPIIYESGTYDISWLASSDSDFNAYKLYAAPNEDMSDANLVYSSEIRNDTTHNVTGIGEMDYRYYQIVVEDDWGLKTPSDVQLGIPAIVFVKTLGGNFRDVGHDVCLTTDGGYIITGETQTAQYGKYDAVIIKIDDRGNQEWNTSFGDSDSDRGYAVEQTTDGGYIITGMTTVPFLGYIKLLLVKMNSAGEEMWSASLGSGDGTYGRAIEQTLDGGYIVTGYTGSFGTSLLEVLLIKTDSQGSQEWYRTFGGNNEDYGFDVQQTSDGGYVIAGKTASFGNGRWDTWLIKTDSQGNEEWNNTYGGTNWDYGYSVTQTIDGGYTICGFTESFGNGLRDIWLIKTGSLGQEEWSQTFGGAGFDEGHSVEQTLDGGYIICGFTESSGNGKQDIWIIKTDPQGNQEWNKTIGANNSDISYSIKQTVDDGYILTGTSESIGNGKSDIIVIKTDSYGNTHPFYRQ